MNVLMYIFSLFYVSWAGKIYLGRSSVRDVAEKRQPELNMYLKVSEPVCMYVYVFMHTCVQAFALDVWLQ